MGQRTVAYRALVRSPEGKTPILRSCSRRKEQQDEEEWMN
jgi:hypothetical protein